MDVFGLVPTLTLLHIVFQVPSSSEPPFAPTLSVQPAYQKYFEGETVRLICWAFRNLTVLQNVTVQGYRFFREGGQQIFQMAPDPTGEGKMDFRAQMNNTGNYSCAYWLEEAGKKVQSPQSKATSIQVNEAPLAPSLSMNSTFSNPGDSVSLECLAPPKANEIVQFRFIGDKMAGLVIAAHSSFYRYNLTVMEDKTVGTFRCAYSQHLYGRTVNSQMSNPVLILGQGVRWVRLLAVGGSFFSINGLIFLIFHCLLLRQR
ncbi:uncharacterized protein LOC134497441 [Candoia aspera]|uniref:uncharacterized protein LOC134497441 n=1 Tax=Candoia aspera TaxID=51853 RepID=UPI002FD844BF